jgi:FixJ family two-component response regulator
MQGCWVSRELGVAVIDDDESFRTALVESLASLGYAASGYASAEDYVDTIDSHSFSCVVTDIHMPGASGFELIKRLSTEDSLTPVVLITAHSDDCLAAKAAAAGAASLLRKPFKTDDLIECIEKAVEG